MKGLETWIYMMVDKAFFASNGHEYAAALGEGDIQLCCSYDDAIRQIKIRDEVYSDLGYKLKCSGSDAEGGDLLFWKRLEKADGSSHVIEVRRKIVVGELFQLRHS